MTEPKNSAATRLKPEDKAERTTRAAAAIISTERNASDAKVARLKALRLAGQDEVSQPAKPAGRASSRRATATSLRKIALQGDAPRKKAK